MVQRKTFQPLLVLFFLFLSGCGSGGGGGTPSPGVAQVNPPNQASNVPVNSSITAKFSSRIDPVTVNKQNFFVLDGAGQMPGAVTYQDDLAVFKPDQPFGTGKQYNAVLTTGIKDLDGVPLPSNFTWSFTTEGELGSDTTPPTILSTVPGNREEDVPADAPIIVTFSESIAPATLNAQTFFIKGGAAATLSYDDVTHRAKLTPSKPLAFSKTYQATVTKGVTDLAGNPLGADFSWEFTTAANSDRAFPKIVAWIPAKNANGVATNTDISVTFDENVDESSIRVRLILTDESDVQVPATFSYDLGSKTATLHPSNPLAPGKTYRVAVKRGVTDLSGNSTPNDEIWSFVTGGADIIPPVVTTRAPGQDATGVSVRSSIAVTFSKPMNAGSVTAPGNFNVAGPSGFVQGIVSYSSPSQMATFTPVAGRLDYNARYTVVLSGGIRDSTGNSLNDPGWSFATIEAPAVIDQSPAGANISTPVSIRAIFSRSMKRESINSNSFQVIQEGTSGRVQGAVTYDDLPGNQGAATFTPISLADNTIYRVTLTTAIEDPDGNPLPQNVTWTFQTAAPPDPAPTVSAMSPTDGAANVPVNIAGISARFHRPIDPSSLQGQFTVEAPGGGLPPRIEYDGAQMQATFVLQGPLNYNTTYTATLRGGIRSASGTPMGSDWVWRFTTEAAPDTTPPSFVRSEPANNARIATTEAQPVQIQAFFSEPIAPSSVNGATFRVQRIDSEFEKPDHSGTYRFEGSTVTFIPSNPYQRGRSYQVTLSTGITDLAGNHLPFDVVWSFSTEP